MNTTEKNKWQVRGAVLAIFLLGFLAGLLALNVYQNWAGGDAPRTNNRANIQQTLEQLGLNETQQSEVRGIFDEARNQMRDMRRENQERRREVRRRTDERLQKILTPEQWQQFQEIRNAAAPRDSRRGNRDRQNERE